MQNLICKVKWIILLMKLGIILNPAYNLLYPMKNSLYVEIYPFDLSFEDPFTKIQLWLPIKQETYDIE